MSDTPSQNSERLTLLACQISVPQMTTITERDRHLATSVEKVEIRLNAAETPVDLVVLPELSSIDYSRETLEHLPDLVEDLQGASFEAWRNVARKHGIHVAYSFPRIAEDGIYICVAVVAPTGELLGHYDKVHLAQYGASMEKEFFTRGTHAFVFQINGFRLAPIICYDIRIPELSRMLVVDQKSDVILHCGAYYRDESFFSWHPFVLTRALENQVFVLSLNRAGKTYGQSLFCLPWHDENSRPTDFNNTAEDFRTFTLKRQTLIEARQKYSFLEDKLADYKNDLKVC